MTRKMSVVFDGEVSHTGPTPMANRRDALRGAARAIEALYSEIERANAGAHAAAARISVFPNSPNVVAGRVRVWFEVRHEDEAVVDAISDRFLARIDKEAGAIGVQISIAVDERRAASMLDPTGFEMVRSVASDLGMNALTVKTVAGHDALAIQKRIPSSLIFVPSQGGLSHNPREFTAPEALEYGFVDHIITSANLNGSGPTAGLDK